jgi:hypothetical protein
MQKAAWVLLFALQLPAEDPMRERAIAALSQRLAERFQADLHGEDDPVVETPVA